jgi:NADPH:quinone reductase-like Zn-dependent oxidoreductase
MRGKPTSPGASQAVQLAGCIVADYYSAQMRAAVYSKGPSGKVLEIKDLEQPVPKNNEVLIRVSAASVNPLDWRLKGARPGVDVAGQVVAVGSAVTQSKDGDVVFGACKGAFS